MKSHFRPFCAALLMASLLFPLAGCYVSEDSVTEVEVREKSPSSPSAAAPMTLREKIHAEIDVEGIFTAVSLVDGDILRFYEALEDMFPLLTGLIPPEIPLPDNLTPALLALGLEGVLGLGVSSTRQEEGFTNRVFVALADERRGLLRGLSTPARSVALLEEAPAHTIFAFEGDLQTRHLREVLLELVTALAGDMGAAAFTGALMMPVGDTSLGIFDLLNIADARIGGYLTMAGDFTDFADEDAYPEAFAVHLQLEGLYRETEKLLHGMTFPEGAEWIQGEDGYILTMEPDPDFPFSFLLQGTRADQRVMIRLNEALLAGAGLLRDTPAFARLTNGFYPEANAFLYLDPVLPGRVVAAIKEQIALEADEMEALGASLMVDFLMGAWQNGFAVQSVNRPHGFLLLSNSPYSKRGQLVQTNVAGVAVLAAIAIPAFQRTRENAQGTMVMNNLRWVSSAGLQHLLETGGKSVAFPDIPEEFLFNFSPVAGESYDHLVIHRDGGVLEVMLPDGRTFQITY